ncbi:HGxxPAAW family protein [Nocardioides alcanivorans]|uniref:HGxxPAAW family protein n=1 Tax=Nocardioides alcanivorans TaxID=2897352 RepID=UPI001F18E7CA|nr:HGxxPAAW family protein [Nocardioides alcanivorans]
MSAHHGNTPAAWTAVAVAMVGFLVASIALMLSPINLTIMWIGFILVPVALVVFVVMNKMGFGDS